MDLEKFSEFIKELRKEKGLNQEELADELHVHRTTVVKWEQGKSLPLNDTLIMLSKYFNVSVDELLAGGRISNETPIEEKNKVTLFLLKSRRKSMRYAKYFAIIAFILFVIFLIYYFFTTYNSIHVYLLYGESENIKIRDSLFTFSNDKAYLRFGTFIDKNDSNVDIDKIRLYYDNEYDTKLLFSGDPNEILVEYRDNLEIFDIYKLKEQYNNLYLIINYNGKEEIIELEAVKDFENKSLFEFFFRNTNKNYVDNNIEIKLSDKFIYDENTETYKLKDKNVEIECFMNNYYCRIFVNNYNYEISYEYDNITNILDYQIWNDGRITDKLSIGLNNILNEKEQKIFNDFKENILDKYLS